MTALSPNDAARRIVAAVEPLPTTSVELDDAQDLVLAEDVRSPLDLPPWDNSAMDGYAVRTADARAGAMLRIGEVIRAGDQPRATVAPGTCARIFTGAPIPPGADAVIRQEDVTVASGSIRIENARDAGKNVRPRGEDLRAGDVAVARGTPLGPPHIAVLASIACREVRVHRRPRVAILASGDELAPLEERDAIVAGKKVASSNTYALRAMVRAAGGEVIDLGIARDDPADLQARLAEGARAADLVVTTAGVSVGEHDHVRDAVRALGGEQLFWRIGMRPGGTTAAGRLGPALWLGLPGNPVSTMVTFELFARPAMRKMLGHALLFRRAGRARTDEVLRAGGGLRHYVRAVLTEQADGWHARSTGPQGSAIQTSMARANALVMVPEDTAEVAAGEAVQTMLLAEPVHRSEPEY